MNLSDLGILALADGVADVLAIDGSGHSLLAARLLGWRAGGVSAWLHLGAACAIALYFWRDMALIGSGLWKLRKLRVEAGTRLMTKILAAALPLMVVTIWWGKAAPLTSELLPVGVVTILCAVLMLVADRLSLTVKRIEHIGIGTTTGIGALQLLSLMPGVGYSWAALTMARIFGMERLDAYRFTLLVSLPILLTRATCDFVENGRHGRAVVTSDLLAFGLTWVLVLLAVPLGFSLIRQAALMPVIIYRLVFGAALIGLGLL